MNLAGAIVGHLVGDYLLQTDWMARNKKSRSWPCAVHCFLWATAVYVFGDCQLLGRWAILFLTHYIQDRTNIVVWWMDLRWKDQSDFVRGACAPWSVIVVDNVWHIVTIWAVWRFT